jgi:signal transduction histidine kinase
MIPSKKWNSMSGDAQGLPQSVGWNFLANSNSVAVLQVNRSGTVVSANRHACELTGKPLVGQPWHTMLLNFNGVSVLDRWLAEPARPRLLNIETAAGPTQTLEVVVERIGEDYLLLGEINSLEQSRLGSEVLELNSELNNLSRELALKNGELAQLNALKNQFLGMAAHDLRKPTGLILNYAEFLLDDLGVSMSPEHLGFLHTIRDSASRMGKVVGDFLDVSLIEAGHFSVDAQPERIENLVTSAMELVKSSATQHQVQILREQDLEANAGVVLLDGPKIVQALTNLLSNAVEHSPPGGVVTITVDRSPNELKIVVSDKGSGMTDEQKQQLFKAYAGSQARKDGGARSVGLGLAIVHKIIEAHGGRMLVTSTLGQGSSFGFSLPL